MPQPLRHTGRHSGSSQCWNLSPAYLRNANAQDIKGRLLQSPPCLHLHNCNFAPSAMLLHLPDLWLLFQLPGASGADVVRQQWQLSHSAQPGSQLPQIVALHCQPNSCPNPEPSLMHVQLRWVLKTYLIQQNHGPNPSHRHHMQAASETGGAMKAAPHRKYAVQPAQPSQPSSLIN